MSIYSNELVFSHLNKLKALADMTRFNLLAKIGKSKNGCDVNSCCRYCSVNQSVVSRHLQKLQDARLVTSEKQGKNRIYKIRCEGVIEVIQLLEELLKQDDSSNSVSFEGRGE